MTAATRRAAGLSVAVVGVVLAIVGLWFCVNLGPSGEASFSTRLDQTGAVAIEPTVLNTLDTPAEVSITRPDAGPLWVGLAGQSDASALLGNARRTSVSAVSWPSGAVSSKRVGSTPLPDVTKADVWRVSDQARGSAHVVVPQGAGPETLVVAAPGGAPLADVNVSVSWHDKTWFFVSLLLFLVGALLAAGAGFFVWQELTAAPAPQPGAPSRGSRHQQRRSPLRRRSEPTSSEEVDA